MQMGQLSSARALQRFVRDFNVEKLVLFQEDSFNKIWKQANSRKLRERLLSHCKYLKDFGREFMFSSFCLFMLLVAAHLYLADLDGLKYVLEKMEFSEGAVLLRKKLVGQISFISAKTVCTDNSARQNLSKTSSFE